LKKLVVFLVVAIMMFSLVGTAFAADFNDVNDLDKKAQDCIGKLTALEVLEGYPDGSFKPAATITRAEFAKVATIMAGLKDSAEIMVNTNSQFKDVKAGEWHTGWINIAAAQGFVKGYPDGTFKPKNQITYAEVVTVLLRVLGYNDNLPGPWPVDYVAKAGALGITDDVNFNAKEAATRVDVAVMSSATLEEIIVDWNNDKEKFENETDTTKDTLIEANFKANIAKGLLEFVKWNSKDKLVAVIDGVDKVLADDVKETGFIALEGNLVNYVLNDDGELTWAGVQSDSIVITTDEITLTDDNAQTPKLVELSVEVNDKDVEYDIADDCVFYVGFTKGSAPAEGTYTADRITVVINDDEEVVLVKRTTFTGGNVLEDVDAENLEAGFENGGDLEIDADKDTYRVIKNGQLATFADLKDGDVAYVYTAGKGLDYYIVAVNDTVSGTLTDANAAGTKVTVDGEEYILAQDVYYSTDNGKDYDDFTVSILDTEDLFDSEVKLLLDPVGHVKALVFGEGGAEEKYAVIVGNNTGVMTPKGAKSYVELMLMDGTEISVEYDADDFDGTPKLNIATSIGLLVTYEVDSDNVLDDMEAAATSALTEKEATEVDGKRVKIAGKWYYTNSDTKFITVDPADKTDADITDWDEVSDAIKGGAQTVTVVLSGSKIEYMVIHEVLVGSSNTAVVMGSGRNADGLYYRLNVGGEVKRYNIDGVSVTGIVYEKEAIVEYVLTDGEISSITAKSAADVTGKVVAIDKENQEIKVEVAVDTFEYITIDEDTIIWDTTGDDPATVTFSNLAKRDNVKVWVVDGIADYIVIE
jgi:hypothetical protein